MAFTDTPPLIELREQTPLFTWISDGHLSLVAPVAAYWVLCSIYYLIDVYELAERYRIHTPQEVDEQNKCSLKEVIRAVVMQHIIQTVVGYGIMKFDGPDYVGDEDYLQWKIQKNLGVSPSVAYLLFWFILPLFKQFFAFFMIDTWQYFFHRFMHLNKWAYRNFHSVHHRLYVPYAFGALYNSLIEGFLLDTAGTGLASMIIGMSARENIVLYTFSTIKTVDDHCGYEFPWDPLQWIFPNRATYHDIHHQQFGIKTNFSQPFFVHWDMFFGSIYERTDEYVEENKKIRLAKADEKLRLQKELVKSEKAKTAKPSETSQRHELKRAEPGFESIASGVSVRSH